MKKKIIIRIKIKFQNMKKDSKPIIYDFLQCSEQVHLILKNIHSES